MISYQNLYKSGKLSESESGQIEGAGRLGIENLATDSGGKVFSGKQVDKTRHRYGKLRAKAPKCGKEIGTQVSTGETHADLRQGKKIQEGYEPRDLQKSCLQIQICHS